MNICPFLNTECIQHKCMQFVHFTMKDPQTGRDRDEWTCSFSIMPMMMLENANQIRQVSASVDSMRNEVVVRQDIMNSAAVLGRPSKKFIPIRDVSEEQNLIEDK